MDIWISTSYMLGIGSKYHVHFGLYSILLLKYFLNKNTQIKRQIKLFSAGLYEKKSHIYQTLINSNKNVRKLFQFKVLGPLQLGWVTSGVLKLLKL